MNTLHLTRILRQSPTRISYRYRVDGEWKKYFRLAPWNQMWVEYDEDVSHVPDSVAVLPLIGNVIVLASMMDATIYVDEIDRDFYNCVESFLTGYETNMPKHVHFKKTGLIQSGRIVEHPVSKEEANLLFFSGGVDATSSLISHLDEKPVLVNIWGADVAWYQQEAWKKAEGFNRQVADRYGLRLATIRSNFRLSLNDEAVNDLSLSLVRDHWWPAFHHSLAMMTLGAPLACGKRKKLYFASTYSSKDDKNWGGYLLASDPLIDNNVRFCGCQVQHDGYEFSRHDKVQRICRFYDAQDEKPFLRVCYHSNEGVNCGHCRKCSSAILSMLVEGSDPESYGFHYDKQALGRSFAAGLMELGGEGKYPYLSLYRDLQLAYQRKMQPQDVPAEMRVFYETSPEMLAAFLASPENGVMGAGSQAAPGSLPGQILRKAQSFYRRMRMERGAALKYWMNTRKG